MQNYEPNTTENVSQSLVEPDEQSLDIYIPTPDDPPWNSGIAFLMWIVSVALIAIFPLLFVLPYLSTQQANLADQDALNEFIRTDTTAIVLQILSILPAHLLTLFLGWLIVTRLKRYSFKQTLGWEMNGFKLWHSLAIIVGFFALNFLLVSLFGEHENDFTKMLENSRAAVYAVAVLATFTAPVVEELVYRGIMYSAFQRTLGKVWGVVLVTFLFALVHVPQYSKDFIPDFQTIGLLLLLSLTLTMIRVYTKNLLPCIILHTIFNGSQSLIAIIEPYLQEMAKKTPEQAAAIFHLIK